MGMGKVMTDVFCGCLSKAGGEHDAIVMDQE